MAGSLGETDDSTRTVRVTECDDIVEVVIDRPPANALDDDTIEALTAALAGLDQGALGGLLLTGAGERFFSAGGDIKELAEIGHETGTGRVDRFNGLLAVLGSFTAPVAIAANGIAVGGGTEMLLVCDHAVGIRGARFGLPEINHGLLPSAASIAHAVDRLGFIAAREMLLTGDLFDAEKALALGIVQELADSVEDCHALALDWLKKMAAKPSVLVAEIKRALDEARWMDHAGHVELTREQFTAYFEDPEATAARQEVLRRWAD